MRIIFLASVMHTGTTFTQRLLERAPQVSNTIEMEALGKNPLGFRDPFTGQHGLIPDTVNLVKAHLLPRFEYPARVYAALFPTVVPLRDPLLSLISRKQRRPDMPATQLVDQWLALATRIDTLERRPFFLLVDALAASDKAARHLTISGLADHLDLPRASLAGVIEHWEPENSVGDDCDLKYAYYAGEFRKLYKAMKPELIALQNVEHILKPLLAKCGYDLGELIW